MAMWMHWSNTESIAQWSMSRAISEAFGCRHWATNHSILPRRLPGYHAKQQQWKNTSALLAIPMVMTMRWYATAHIAQWRRSRASLEATGHRHWEVLLPKDEIGHAYLSCFQVFSSSTCWIRLRFDTKAPVFNRSITYQRKEKGFTKVSKLFVGGVKL